MTHTCKQIFRVTLGDQSVYEADIVGYDEDKDVAVLHIDAPKDKVRPIPVGTSSDLLVGQKVYAIGNPVGKSTFAIEAFLFMLSKVQGSRIMACDVLLSQM